MWKMWRTNNFMYATKYTVCMQKDLIDKEECSRSGPELGECHLVLTFLMYIINLYM